MVSAVQETANPVVVVECEIDILAPPELAFAALLEELGPANEGANHTPMPMVLEARPGGKWWRDLGDDSGHFWGVVQVIKAPTLLEIMGPLFMSYPCLNHVQYRLTAQGSGTRLKLVHRSLGISGEHQEGVKDGWSRLLERARRRAMSHS